MSDIHLTDCSFDVILYGTSLTHTIIAAACAKQGLKVLHVDASEQYGAFNQTANLTDYIQMCHSHNGPLQISSDQSISDPNQTTEWQNIIKTAIEQKTNDKTTEQSTDQSTEPTDQSADSSDQSDHSSDAAKKSSSSIQTIQSVDSLTFHPIVEPSNASFHSASITVPTSSANDQSNAQSNNQTNQQPDNQLFDAEQSDASANQSTTATQNCADSQQSTQLNGESSDHTTESISQSTIQSINQSINHLLSQSRHFSIDLSPSLLLSRSSIVRLMVDCWVSHYIDFRAVDSSLVCFPSSLSTTQSADLYPLPLSQAQVFACTFLGLSEKRGLSRIIQSIIPTHHMTDQQKQECDKMIEQFGQTPFVEFVLRSKAKSERLIDFVLYAVAQASSNQSNNQSNNLLSTSEAAARIKLYLSSLGRFSTGAHLSPMYGIGELPQGFARLAAVHSASYILRFKPHALVFQSNDQSNNQSSSQRFVGVISPSNQFLSATHFVGCATDFPMWIDQSINQSISCAVLITDAPIRAIDGSANEETFLIVMPQPSNNLSINQSDNHPVRVIQLGTSVHASPNGMFVIHLTMPRVNGAETDLKPVVKYLTSINQTNNQSHDQSDIHKPKLLFSSYHERTPARARSDLPVNVHVTDMPSPLESIDQSINQAELIFSRICPDVNLFDALKHVDDNPVADAQLAALDELDLIIAAASNNQSNNQSNDQSKNQVTDSSSSDEPSTDGDQSAIVVSTGESDQSKSS